MSKKSLKNLHQAHGKIVSEEITGLDQIFNKESSYKTSLAAKYQDKIGSMTLEELKDIAGELGVIPVDNRDSLIKMIRKEFKKR